MEVTRICISQTPAESAANGVSIAARFYVAERPKGKSGPTRVELYTRFANGKVTDVLVEPHDIDGFLFHHRRNPDLTPIE